MKIFGKTIINIGEVDSLPAFHQDDNISRYAKCM